MARRPVQSTLQPAAEPRLSAKSAETEYLQNRDDILAALRIGPRDIL